jgi:hypothetical protein
MMSVFRRIAAIYIMALICASNTAYSQQTESSLQKSIGQRAVTFLLSRFAIDTTNIVSKTGKPLQGNGQWTVGKETPTVCPASSHECVSVTYLVQETDVMCKWVVLATEDTSRSILIDTNEDAARYLTDKKLPDGTPPLRKAISAPAPRYPHNALSEHLQGTVKLLVIINQAGHVDQVEFISGPEDLRSSAIFTSCGGLYADCLADTCRSAFPDGTIRTLSPRTRGSSPRS